MRERLTSYYAEILENPRWAKHALVATGSDYLLAVPQQAAQGVRADTVDRIELGAALLADLVAAGL